MTKNLLIFLLSFTSFGYSQNINLILQVNGKILTGEISNLHINLGTEESPDVYPANYYPGDLIISQEVLDKIDEIPSGKFILHFDYNTYEKDKHQIANFDVTLHKKQLGFPYLIINVYDFRDKKYRKWYSYLTDKDYLPEIICINCGIYLKQN